MHLKREFKREAFASRIFKTLRNYTLPVIFGFFLLALTANTASAEPTTTQQQTVRISGKIVDSSGEPLIGASVVEKGTTNGTATDTNGAYTLSVNPNATIEVKYIGFLSQSFKAVSGRNVYDIAMKEDSKSLDEVVVIGYGVQKKKLVTGATISVSGEDIEKLSTTNPFAALQSKTPGVSIYQGSGQPGEDYIINIRGIGTNGNSKPLYVVDGVASGDNALNSMSPADIESIDILKDAASAAIYGSRAANGVVLITTKQGKVGKPHITYTGSYGQQYMAKKPDMLDAKQYILVQDEISFNEGTPPYEWANLLPAGKYDDIMSGKWKGTDWVDAFYNKGAQVQNHSLNLTGGNEYSKFSIGYSYMKKDGIFGEAVQPHWNRSTFRINSEHVILKVKDFNAITIGENLNYNYRTKQGISIGGMYWNAFHNILTANPLMPVYNDDGTYYDYDSKVRDGWNFDGNFGNPIASVAHNSQGLNLSKNHNLNASVNIQIQPIKGLIFKSQYAYQMSASSYRSDDQKIHLSNITNTTTETVNQDQSVGYYWKLDNTLTYNFSVNAHHVEAQIGQSAEKGAYGEAVRAMGKNNIFDLGWDYAWVSNTRPTQLNEVSAGGYPIGQNPSDDNPWGPTALASFWGRAHYNYNETYLATLILRADGSSNFARGHRWGYFPSVSAGWVLTNEPFLETAKGTLDFLKLRASWGQNGNSNITPFQYLNQYKLSATALYYFGTDKITQSSGAKPGVLRNPDVTWETSEQTDLGFDSRFLSNRLGVIFDYYVKTTKNWLLITPISAAYGFDPPYGNGGDMKNSGVELALSWDDHIGDFRYGINLNGRYNQGKVTKINNSEKIIHGDGDVLSQGTSEFYRLQVGLPYGFFYGYKADGIFQNWDEVNAYTYTYVDEDTGKTVTKPIIPGTKPGDVRFRDVNGDGKIDEKDKMPIGNCQPKVIAGFGLNLAYKGFDFIASAHGEFGMQIAKSYRSVADSRLQNFTTDIFGRWTGEGTSNKIPRLTSGNSINYQNVSDIYIENADYVKIQNLTLGYDFKRLMPKLPLGQARLYVTAENAFTITGYSGQDPEVGFGNGKNYMRGIDLGFYPSAKTYLVGVNLTF